MSKKNPLDPSDAYIDALRRIGNGELHVRERMIHEGAHSYMLSGEALDRYERHENDLLGKIERLESENKRLRAELEALRDKGTTTHSDPHAYYPTKKETKRRFTFKEMKKLFCRSDNE